MTKVVWLKRALKNIEDIHRYYCDEGLHEHAKKIVARLLKSIKQLQEFPALGRPGRVSGTRELLIHQAPYIVVYREKELQVEILRVLHSSQKWPRSDPTSN